MSKFSEYSEVELSNLINDLHNVQKFSIREIARKLETYPVKILRFCKKHDIPTMSKSESLKSVYNSGRVIPSMLGKTRTEESKQKISEGQYQRWKSLSQEERNKRGKTQSEIFAKRTDKKDFINKGHRAIRRAIEEGSKLEKQLMGYFDKNGIEYKHHYTGIFQSTKLEADFFLPELNTVIEVDGPSHFSADFGIDNYSSQIKADEKKNGLVISLGASIIRLQHRKTLSQRDYREIFKLLDDLLDNLDNTLKVINVEDL